MEETESRNGEQLKTPKCQTVDASLTTGNPNLNVSKNLWQLKTPLEHTTELKSCWQFYKYYVFKDIWDAM
jgi:hypothetical protein